MEPPAEIGTSPFTVGDAGAQRGEHGGSGHWRRRSRDESAAARGRDATGDAPTDAPADFQGHMAHMMWSAGSAQVQRAVHTYGRIDLFRPYFDVQPGQVRARLVQAMLPRRPSQMQVPNDLYGPLMVLFTLVALLLLHMKTSAYAVQNGTLMGTALFTCFGYWSVVGVCLYAFLYVVAANAVSLVQTLSVLGYGLVGHCVVILLTAVFHPVHTHVFFFAITLVFGGLTAVRMIIFFVSKARDRAHKLLLAASLAALHFGFLLYLHFAFESFVEELDEVLLERTSGNHRLFTSTLIDELASI